MSSRRRKANAIGRPVPTLLERYDFRRSDKLSREHMRSLQLIHETFCRSLSSSLSGYLRASVLVELQEIVQISHEEYLQSQSEALLHILRVDILSGDFMFSLDMHVLFSMIDRLLGGAGDGPWKSGQALTDVEQVLSRNIVSRALVELSAAWHPIAPLAFEIAAGETDPQYVQLMPGTDAFVVTRCTCRLAGQSGSMTLAIPYALLKPLLARLPPQHWFPAGGRTGPELAPEMALRLKGTGQVPCIARLGTCATTVSALANLVPGDILTVAPAGGHEAPLRLTSARTSGDQAQGSEPPPARVDVIIGSAAKFVGTAGVTAGRRLAVQIDEVLDAALPGEARPSARPGGQF